VIRAAKFRPTLRALEEGETFIVPHLLWHRACFPSLIWRITPLKLLRLARRCGGPVLTQILNWGRKWWKFFIIMLNGTKHVDSLGYSKFFLFVIHIYILWYLSCRLKGHRKRLKLSNNIVTS
jgi:hypothetical protein